MAKLPVIHISGASVKVMRSYDYCHFEVSLSSVQEQDPATGLNGAINTLQVDEMRKEAMRLVDKAVEQYKIAKKISSDQANVSYMRMRLRQAASEAQKTPVSERTEEQKAAIKALADYEFFMDRGYNYEDDWDEDDWERQKDAFN